MPQTKACLAYGKAVFAPPALDQISAMNEDAPGLFQRPPCRVIDVVKIGIDGHATLIESRYGRNQRLIVAGHTFCFKKYGIPSRTMIRDRAGSLLLTKVHSMPSTRLPQIGRASGRERVCQYV